MLGIKYFLRFVLATALYYSGLLWVYAHFKLKDKAVVLMYHRVLPPDSDSFSHEGIIVSPATFERQLRFLKRFFHPLSLEEFRESLEGPGFAGGACLITFDDGWQDNLAHAYPVLQRHRVPAVVFVATDYIGSDKTFWQESLTRLLYAAVHADANQQSDLAHLGIDDLNCGNAQDIKQCVRNYVTRLKGTDKETIHGLMAGLRSTIGRDAPEALNLGQDRFLTWDELRELVRHGLVRIASHAQSHTPLPVLAPDRALDELVRSKREIETGLQANVFACAYPNGDFDTQSVAAVKDAGYRMAFTTQHGHVQRGDDAWLLHRINVHERGTQSSAEFLVRILGLF